MKKIFILALFIGLLAGCSQTARDSSKSEKSNVQTASMLPVPAKSAAVSADQDVWLESMITATPQEGRELAIIMARKTIGAIQSDPEVKKRLRGLYAEDAELLILSAEVVAIEYQTVAAANNYWRK